jgi:predicted nucleic acid-binding protein
MESVYVETTIASYLAARPSRDLVKAARQEVTWEWWLERSGDFELFISQAVIREASAGDEAVSKRRLELLEQIPFLDITMEADRLADDLVSARVLPPKAIDDALHIAVAAVHGMDYLLTWNCRHLANMENMNRIESFLLDNDLPMPRCCTPDELMEKPYA